MHEITQRRTGVQRFADLAAVMFWGLILAGTVAAVTVAVWAVAGAVL